VKPKSDDDDLDDYLDDAKSSSSTGSTGWPPKSRLDLSLGNVTIFTSMRNPNLSPQPRPTELPFSQSSPVRDLRHQMISSTASSFSTSGPDPYLHIPSGADIIGIEDISDTQWAAGPDADEGEGDEEGSREAMELELEAGRIQAVQQRNIEKERRADPRKAKLGTACFAPSILKLKEPNPS